VRQAARDIGGVTDWDAKYAAALELVKGDIALGRQLNITQTPTFFLNGVKVEGAWAPQFFDQAIAYELAHAKYAGREPATEPTEITELHGALWALCPLWIARACPRWPPTISPKSTQLDSGASAPM
jgi:hypothetical protein